MVPAYAVPVLFFRYKTLSFGLFDEIYQLGYNHAATVFQQWVKANYMDKVMRSVSDDTSEQFYHNNDRRVYQVFAMLLQISDHVIYSPQTAVGGKKTEGSNTIMSTSFALKSWSNKVIDVDIILYITLTVS